MLMRDWRTQAREVLDMPAQPEAETFNLILPNSSCPNCDHEIKPWENIPLVSWLFLRGKCSNCKEAISIRYPLVELACGRFFCGHCLAVWCELGSFGDAGADLGLVINELD